MGRSPAKPAGGGAYSGAFRPLVLRHRRQIMLKIKSASTAIPAQDIKRARKFYEQKLGLTVAEEQPDCGVVYRTDETGFLVFPNMGKASGYHTYNTLEVDYGNT